MLHAREDQFRRYRTAFVINTSIWVLQFLIVGTIAYSLALLGDAAHSFSDSLVILGTLLLVRATIRAPEKDHEGVKRLLIRTAIILLWVSAAFIAKEGYGRIISPIYFPGWPVVGIALLSAAGNFLSHRIIHGVHKSLHDHVHRANVLHILADLFISIAVVISGLGTILFQLPAIDGWIACIVALWMFIRGATLWRENTHREHTHTHEHHH